MVQPTLAGRRVLIVDDDPLNLKLMSDALSVEKFEVERASSGAQAIEKIENWQPELVLFDYGMPGMSGLEALRMLRNRQNYVAVIFVSANTEQELIVDCLGAGADDYLRKPFHFSELLSRVKVRFRIKDLSDQLQAANAKLAELAVTDDLTGLFNMRSMYERIDTELRRAKRFDRRVSCIMLDIDHFKEVNDRNDHLFGSFVIKEMGGLIRKNMRDVDFAARYGGDEFLIVLTETNEAGTKTFAERLRGAIEKHVFTDGKSSLQRTCSFGFSLSEPASKIDARELVRQADHALYRAKNGGRNRISS
ncbi:diguanylate cyclase [bacterium]|nr:diguanylate cyclase [bacterium]